MTYTLPGGDVRGFYAALGIDLRGWQTGTDVCIRCVFDPDAHHHGDRRPSLSVSLEHGAFYCHGCGAKGGAFDAATRRGHSDRSAMHLLVRYGLAPPLDEQSANSPRHDRAARRTATRRRSPAAMTARPRLAVSHHQLQRWRRQLLERPDVLARLATTRGWSEQTICALELGLDHWQITIPVRDQHGALVSLLRYRPRTKPGEDKMRATFRSERVLYPHPAAETSRRVLLVEGEPDAIAARSHGLPALAIPGVDGWRPEWAPLFVGRDVLIALDADRQGRDCARKIANQLREHASTVVAVDLAPQRADGYDLTDWLMAHQGGEQRTLEQLLKLSCHVPHRRQSDD